MSTAHIIRRHARAFRHAWRQRHRLDTPDRLGHEVDFLPAVLALRDKPIHPAPRWTIRLILLFTVIALAWAVFGQIDIVATAAGKVIPSDYSKVVQPIETAVVKAIHIRNGLLVSAGDLLVELDATQAEADSAQVASDLDAAQREAARAQALLRAIDTGHVGTLPALAGAEGRMANEEQRLLEGEYAAFATRVGQIDAEIERRRAELRSADESLAKLKEVLPIVRSRAVDYKNLMEQKFISRHGWLDKEQARIEAERELVVIESRQMELAAGIREAGRQQSALTAEMRRATLEKLREAEQRATVLQQARIKAANRGRLMRLTAPVSGTVQQLAVHTPGGVVTPAQPLMVIVPSEHALEIEAFVLNRDIGFLDQDQSVEVKIESFPFTRYGTLKGRISHISNDAIQDEKQGLVYAARIVLDKTFMTVDGKRVALTPGMAVTVEVKTGRRRVIEYFLSPLIQYGNESLRER